MTVLTVSPAAASRIRKIIADEPAGTGLRVAVEGGGCSGFQYDIGLEAAPGKDDHVIEAEGARVFIDPVSADFVQGSVLDWEDALIGSAFKVKNPNAKSSCGCGVSFSV